VASFRPLDGLSLASHSADPQGRPNDPMSDSHVPADGPCSLPMSTLNWSASMIAPCERSDVECPQSVDAGQSAAQLLGQRPLIRSNGGGAMAIISVPEKTVVVTRVEAIPQKKAETLTYSLVSGADAALFSIDALTGVLTFVAPPELDNPIDADGNSVYDVVVQVSNSIATSTQAIAVEVTSASESDGEADNSEGHPHWTAYARSSTSSSRVNDSEVAGTLSPGHSQTAGHSWSDVVRLSNTAGVRFSDASGASSPGSSLTGSSGSDVVRAGATGSRFMAPTAQVVAPSVVAPSAQVGNLLAIAGTLTMVFGTDGIGSQAAHPAEDRSTGFLAEARTNDGTLDAGNSANRTSNGEIEAVADKNPSIGAGQANNSGTTSLAPVVESTSAAAAVSTEPASMPLTPSVESGADGEATTVTPVTDATTEPVAETTSTTLTPVTDPVAATTTAVVEPVAATVSQTTTPVTEPVTTTTAAAEPVTEPVTATVTQTTPSTEPVTAVAELEPAQLAPSVQPVTDELSDTTGAGSEPDSVMSEATEPSALDVQIGLLEQHQIPATDFVV
jgi:hypothetical protein